METEVMTKKKNMEETAMTEASAQSIVIETTTTERLKTRLEDIKSINGVIGYILRNAKSAAIDLKDPTKLIEYAVLSSSALDAAEELSELFSLGEVDNILVEGKEVKVLSLTIGENRISLFLEKNADIEKLLKKLHTF
jgi:predicted regulator of Ras-like GTPase activity (Roadblock/LC7/MglB family)